MTYRQQFGRYEIRNGADGICYKWFKDRKKAQSYFDWMKEAADEWYEQFGEEVTLVESRSGNVIDRFSTVA